MTKLPVLAAIPNYNHGEALATLLPEVLEQEYDGVVVCDDASSRGDTIDVVGQFRPDVELVVGRENVGAGANRNRVLESETLRKMGEAIIHFLDADTSLISNRNPEQIRELIERPALGLIGGLVRNEAGVQNYFNYGPMLGGPIRLPYGFLTSGLLIRIEALRRIDTQLAATLRNMFNPLLHNYPDTFKEPVARDVGWVIEANMIINSDLFGRIGGFDPALRFHEIQELAIQLDRQGLTRRFDPSIEVAQRAIDVRGGKRNIENARAAARLMARYTLHTKPRYNR